MVNMQPWSAQKILGSYVTIIRDFSLRHYLLCMMQNISSLSSTSDNMVVQVVAPFSKTRSLELRRRFELYSLNTPSEDIANKNYFKDGESFILLYYMVGDEIFLLKDYLMHPYRNKKWKASY